MTLAFTDPMLRSAVATDAFEESCLKQNDRRIAPYDARLIRPVVAPNMIRLALNFMRKPVPAH